MDARTTLDTQRSYIDGGYVASTSGETFATVHPGTNSEICEVEAAGPAEIELAVASARRGFSEWSSLAAVERQRILLRAVSIIPRTQRRTGPARHARHG